MNLLIFHDISYLLFVLLLKSFIVFQKSRFAEWDRHHTEPKDIHTCRIFLFEQHWFGVESSERSLLKYPELANDLRLCSVQVPWSNKIDIL